MTDTVKYNRYEWVDTGDGTDGEYTLYAFERPGLEGDVVGFIEQPFDVWLSSYGTPSQFELLGKFNSARQAARLVEERLGIPSCFEFEDGQWVYVEKENFNKKEFSGAIKKIGYICK